MCADNVKFLAQEAIIKSNLKFLLGASEGSIKAIKNRAKIQIQRQCGKNDHF